MYTAVPPSVFTLTQAPSVPSSKYSPTRRLSIFSTPQQSSYVTDPSTVMFKVTLSLQKHVVVVVVVEEEDVLVVELVLLVVDVVLDVELVLLVDDVVLVVEEVLDVELVVLVVLEVLDVELVELVVLDVLEVLVDVLEDVLVVVGQLGVIHPPRVTIV